MINTLTSGFSNPAEDYVSTRLSLDDLIVKTPLATYFFRYQGISVFDIVTNDILVVDRSIEPKDNVLVIATNHNFNIVKFKNINQLEYWGTIICIVKEK
ncbi:MAG: S24 family peptidase [Candidatus Heimdallarchaeota archaeon]